jgi:hypothetical protein
VIRNSLLAVSADSFMEKESLLLPCDTVTNGEDTGLLFSVGGYPLSAKGNLGIFSARNTIWGPRGLSRPWDAVSYDHVPQSAKRGDIHEKIGNKTRFTTRLDTSAYGRLAPSPKFILFTKEGKESVSKLNSTKVKSLLEKNFMLSPTMNKEEFSAQFEKLVSEYDAPCYLVSGKLSNIKNTVDRAFKGNLSASTSKPKKN